MLFQIAWLGVAYTLIFIDSVMIFIGLYHMLISSYIKFDISHQVEKVHLIPYTDLTRNGLMAEWNLLRNEL